jgi:hypothetical protein
MRSMLFACVLAACGGTSTAPQLGENIEVRLGTSVEIPGDTTRVRFTDVTSDSRCPTGAQCVWAGEAVAVFIVGGKDTVSLTCCGNAQKATAIVRGKQLTFVALKPAPALGGSPAKTDYVATIRFTSAND